MDKIYVGEFQSYHEMPQKDLPTCWKLRFWNEVLSLLFFDRKSQMRFWNDDQMINISLKSLTAKEHMWEVFLCGQHCGDVRTS